MLSALAGGEALEIIVSLKNLSAAGFKAVQVDLVKTGAMADASGGKLGGVGGALGGLVSPLALAAGGLAAVAGAGIAAVGTYQKVHAQTQLLDEALQAHGSSLQAVQDQLDATIKVGAQYGFSADDVRAAVTRLTQAGVDFTTIQEKLPAVLDLANAKQLSAADAADLMAKATLGQARGLADLGIRLPPTIGGLAGVAAAQKTVTADTKTLSDAQAHLTDVEDALKGKHKLTAAEAARLADAHKKVSDAEAKLKTDTDKLTSASNLGANASANFAKAADAVKGSTGDTAGSVDGLRLAQTKLSNAWEDFSTKVGPGLMTIFGHIIDALTTILGFVGDALDLLNKAANSASARTGAGGGSRGSYRAQAAANAGGGFLPHLAGGGVVEPTPGGTLAVIGEGGEREFVIPESKLGGGGGGTSNVHVHLYLDGQELAYTMERPLGSLFALRGTSARLGSGV